MKDCRDGYNPGRRDNARRAGGVNRSGKSGRLTPPARPVEPRTSYEWPAYGLSAGATVAFPRGRRLAGITATASTSFLGVHFGLRSAASPRLRSEAAGGPSSASSASGSRSTRRTAGHLRGSGPAGRVLVPAVHFHARRIAAASARATAAGPRRPTTGLRPIFYPSRRAPRAGRAPLPKPVPCRTTPPAPIAFEAAPARHPTATDS